MTASPSTTSCRLQWAGRATRLAWPLACVAALACAARGEQPPPVVQVIRDEASRRNQDPAGRPLPLAGHWNRGQQPDGFGPDYQLELIRKGCHLLPWFAFPNPVAGDEAVAKALPYYEVAMKQWAAWRLPITLIGTQWEATLYGESRFRDLPPEKNPNVIDSDGKVLKKLDPLGPVEPWAEVGRYWTDTPLMRKLQERYPDPPLVIFVSNNEAADLRWHQVEQSQRYLRKYGLGRDDDFKRRVVGDAWIERYRALQKGMREGLAAEAWRRNVRFVGYGAFGPPHLGRWDGWPEYSLHSKNRISPEPLMWDGGSPSYYTHNWNPSTDFRVWSPQIEGMNWVFMLEEAWRLNPDFWFEFSTWDGNSVEGKASSKPKKKDAPPPKSKVEEYRRQGQTFTPERYKGFCQFGMWLLTPRLMREFRSSTDTRTRVGAYYEALVGAVDAVHASPVLTRFWRESALVPNRAEKHPYQTGIPEEYAGCDRWFLLDTSLDPPRPWTYETALPVFALARVIGKPGSREWLVYAHSPPEPRQGVTVTVPDYGPVQVDVAVGGSFYVVTEQNKETTPVR